MSHLASCSGDDNLDPNYDSKSDVEMIDQQTPAFPARTQPYISDISKNTSTEYPDLDGPVARSSDSGSPPRSPVSKHSFASVPADDEVDFLEVVHAKVPCATRHRTNSKGYRGDEPESRPQDQLEVVLSHPHYQQMNRELQAETRLRKESETLLAAKTTQLVNVQSQAQSQLEKKTKELEEVRKGWKKTAGELNKVNIRAKNQGTHQLTDQYLIDKVTSLRYSIRNFSIQYFDGELKHEPKIKSSKFIDLYVVPMTRQPSIWEELLKSPTWCSSQIQATLWRILCWRVFNQFRWAGKFIIDMKSLYEALRPSSADSLPNAEAERKFQTWSATTASLLLDRLELNEGSVAYTKIDAYKRQIVEEFYSALEPCVRSDKGLKQALFDILGDAIMLDRELSRQVAKVTWVSEFGEFDQLVVAPGLKKRGKSNGEDFKVEVVLLPAMVCYVPLKTAAERRR